jgi:4a-hydroxytetrahydrobiopterin dehydratase
MIVRTPSGHPGGDMRTLLTDAELAAALESLEGWSGDRSAITRTIHLDQSAVDPFLVRLEEIAREMDHDPDLEMTDGDLAITMSTHSAGGVTELDVKYATRVNELVRGKTGL